MLARLAGPARALAAAGLALGLASSCLIDLGEEFGRSLFLALATQQELTTASASPWAGDGESLLLSDPNAPGGLLRFRLDGSTPEVLHLGRFVNPSLSPDGSRLLFGEFDGEDVKGSWRLRLEALDGSESRELVTSFGSLLDFSWAPDGHWILYAGSTIELVRPDGSERRSLGPGAFPVWSPDARRVASVSRDGAERGGIRIRALEESSSHFLTSGCFPSWSPDGTRLAFADSERDELGELTWLVFVIDADGSNRRALCKGLFPRWSPAGDRILVQAPLFGLSTIMADGSEACVLSERGQGGRWSPDGAWIAFLELGRVFAIRPDGSERRELGALSAEDVAAPLDPGS